MGQAWHGGAFNQVRFFALWAASSDFSATCLLQVSVNASPPTYSQLLRRVVQKPSLSSMALSSTGECLAFGSYDGVLCRYYGGVLLAATLLVPAACSPSRLCCPLLLPSFVCLFSVSPPFDCMSSTSLLLTICAFATLQRRICTRVSTSTRNR